MHADHVSSAAARGYSRRQPETTVLYAIVRDHLPALLDRARERSEHGFGYPRFVAREFEKFLACGLLCHGFVRVRCDSCAEERLVAFSCKARGFCPSCTSRRMAGIATALVDRVLPAIPYRQWVLSFPGNMLGADRINLWGCGPVVMTGPTRWRNPAGHAFHADAFALAARPEAARIEQGRPLSSFPR